MDYMDAHAHVFSHHESFPATARYRPDYTASVESYIDQLDQHGFDKAVLVQPSFLGTDNSYLLKALSKYPERLRGIAVLANTVDMPALQALDKQGIVGIRINLFGVPCPDLTDPQWKSFLTNLADIHWQVEIQAPPVYLIQLLPVLKQYPIDIVIDHFGRFNPIKGVQDQEYRALLDMLDPHQHWVKASAYYRLGNKIGIQNATDAIKLLIQHNMSNRLIWGSDWPHTQNESHINFTKALTTFKTIINNEELAMQILTSNNTHLFKF
ncbi:amidohydrolase family protein [Psychrobacter sp. B38]|uniref:amidohydrolase family protein n=1 Tax=Psychrobacter sp. B38 TaxID=3143538 RepID=UPI00320C5C95